VGNDWHGKEMTVAESDRLTVVSLAFKRNIRVALREE
jgi:hypothetical protein